ncbi:MAG: tetratricopeptide repeat protein, partial [Phycisphaerales bacterium]|nr:tetratricopeptide repeat protein [Phycisphaerales bacterium]
FAYKPYIEMLLENGRLNEAGRVLDRFVAERVLSTRCRAQRIELLARMRRWDDAIEDQARFAAGGEAVPVMNLAELYARSGDREKARGVVDFFLQKADRGPEERYAAANVLALIDDFDGAVSLLGGLPAESDLGGRDEVMGRFFLGHLRADLALPYLTEAARASGEVGDWIRALQAATATNDADITRTLLAEARKSVPDAPELRTFDSGSLQRMVAQVYAASVGPEASQEEQQLAGIASEFAAGRFSDREYIDRLTAFTRTEPDVFTAWRLLASTHKELGEIGRAIEINLEAERVLPDDPRPIRELIRLYASEGRTDEAIESAKRLSILMRPDTYEPDVQIAELEFSRGRYEEAADRLMPHRSRIRSGSAAGVNDELLMYVTALARSGEEDDVEELLDDLWTSTDPQRIELVLRAIDALPAESWRTKRDWLLRVTDERVALARAEVWIKIARYSGERADVDRAAELFEAHGDPNIPAWRFKLAEIADLSGQFKEAEQYYRSLIEAFPDAMDPYIGLAGLLSRQPDRAQDAVALIDGVLSRLDEAADPAGIVALGLARAEALGHAGRSSEARTAFERILDASPGHHGATVGLAGLLERAGEADQAAKLLGSIQDPNILDARTRHEIERLLTLLSKP